MKNYLITGASGCGKSAVEAALDQLDYQTNDLDSGFAAWVNKQTGAVITEHDHSGGQQFLAEHRWQLNEARLQERLHNHDGPLFICGIVSDMTDYFDWFDTVFLLEFKSPADLKQRLQERNNNPFGKHPDEVADVLSWYESFQEEAKRRGTIAIDCTQPLDTVVEEILQKI